jgi:hydrogenase small subunit
MTSKDATTQQSSIAQGLFNRGMTRRQFLGFCGVIAAALALPESAGEVIAAALATAPRVPVIWLEFQGCSGDSESFLRAASQLNPLDPAAGSEPKISDLLLDIISLDYHETLMAPSGANATFSLNDSLAKNAGNYILVVEGSIPTGANGHYCVIGGRTATSILQEAMTGAKKVIALGSCAHYGGLAKANPNPTRAAGLKSMYPTQLATNANPAGKIYGLPGCPANVVNLVALLVHFITYPNTAIPMDTITKEKEIQAFFGFDKRIHSRVNNNPIANCFRKDTDREAEMWGDADHVNGGCLRDLGCAGPITYSNCFKVHWNQDTCWPIAAGHGCIGCTNNNFWDTPFYSKK